MAKILIVDDNRMNSDLMRDILKLKGYEIFVASAAQAGLRTLNEQTIDLILLDMRLPNGMTGWELASYLKTQSLYASIPIIAVSASIDYQDETRALTAGCNAYLAKPFSVAKFRELVNSFAIA